MLHLRPDSGDNAGRVQAGGIGKLQIRPVEPGTKISVDRVDPDGLDRHHYLPDAGDQIGHLFQVHHLGSPEIVYANCLH